MGLEPIVAPLFIIVPVGWQAPDAGDVDCIVMTSANAARHAGSQIQHFTALPCYAVGKATAAAVEAAGFADVRTGPRDGAALAAMVAEDGMKRPLHLCGREHITLRHDRLHFERRVVYVAEAAEALPDAASQRLQVGGIALLHSARAGALLARLVGAASLDKSRLSIAAISDAAARAAGPGWRRVAVAQAPRDDALLELAVKLCETDASEAGNDE